jgi:ABC-type nitrate/sulfonate/bicarbonate transport system permease component
MQVTAAPPAEGLGARLRRTLTTPRAARITAPLLFLVAWQLIVPRLPSRIIPTPAGVFDEMIEMLLDGSVFRNFGISLTRLLIGLVLALVVGSLVGVAMGISPRIEAMLHDWVVVGLAFPYLIWGLLVAMWFGFGSQGPIIVVFIAGLPYVMLNMSEGVRDVSKELRDMAHAYDVPPRREIRHLVLPSLSPFFFASLRYGLANGWKGLVLAEVFAATSGAGWAIADTSDYGNFEAMVGYTLYFALFSILVEQLVFDRLARRVFRWRPSEAVSVAGIPEEALGPIGDEDEGE